MACFASRAIPCTSVWCSTLLRGPRTCRTGWPCFQCLCSCSTLASFKSSPRSGHCPRSLARNTPHTRQRFAGGCEDITPPSSGVSGGLRDLLPAAHVERLVPFRPEGKDGLPRDVCAAEWTPDLRPRASRGGTAHHFDARVPRQHAPLRPRGSTPLAAAPGRSL